MNNRNLEGILFIIAGILFFIAAMINDNHIFIPIGCCFVVLGISKRKKDK